MGTSRRKELNITESEFSDVLAESCVELIHRMGRDKDDMFLTMLLATYGAIIMSKLFISEDLEVE